jgi:hypothetical protein
MDVKRKHTFIMAFFVGVRFIDPIAETLCDNEKRMLQR